MQPYTSPSQNATYVPTSEFNHDDIALLEDMSADYQAGPAVYHESVFWKKLNALNTEWLKEDGVANFKRTVNNNYFNWMVSVRSDYFRQVLMHNLKVAAKNPFRFSRFFTGKIIDFWYRTMNTGVKVEPSFFERHIYKQYVMLLYHYVLDRDRRGFFFGMEEPEAGNPLACYYRGKRISQDICNSYLEYQFMADTLGDSLGSMRAIAEIGAGYGRLISVLQRIGLKAQLIVIDIPPALFVSQWYLTRVFPELRIFKYRRFNEFAEVKTEFEKSKLCFLLPHQAELLPDKSIDLIVTISSLQEMTKAQIAGFYELIERKSRHLYTKQWLCWRNPEDNQIVSAASYPTRASWDMLAFRLNPVHRQFFEAIFKL